MHPTTRNNQRMMSMEEMNQRLLQQEEGTAALQLSVNALLGEQAIQKANAQFVAHQLKGVTQQLAEIQGRKVEKIVGGLCTVGKIVIKIGGKEIAFQVARIFSVEVAKTASKVAAKAIPFTGLVIGVAGGVYRCCNGQYIKGTVELASGMTCLIPVLGPILAAAIDVIMAGHDIHECYHSSSSQPLVSVDRTLTLEEAYETFSIKSQNPTKAEVDRAYHYLTQQSNSDHMEQIEGDPLLQESDKLMSYLSACKDLIYKEQGWQ